MSIWKNLHWIQKTIIGVFVMLMVAVMPELLPLLDLGGIELIFGFVLMNLKTAKYWLHEKYQRARELASSVVTAFLGSALAKPKTFIFHGGMCSVVLFFTGSFLFSSVVFLPVMFANRYLV